MRKALIILIVPLLISTYSGFSQNDSTKNVADSLSSAPSGDTMLVKPSFINDTMLVKPSFLNTTIDKVISLFEWQRGGTTVTTFPSFGYDPASAFAFGILQTITLPRRDTSIYQRKTSIINYLSYSTNNWINVRSTLSLFTCGGWAINTRLQFQQSPDKFYGIGQTTRNRNPQKYEIKHLQVYGNFAHSFFVDEVFAGLTYDISYAAINNVQSNEHVLPENELPEQKNNLLIGIGPYIAFDSRDNIHFPTRGQFITAGLSLYPKYNEHSYGFYNYMIDARTYIPILKKQVLAVHVFAGASEGTMPFYKLYQLGGSERMRGISNKYMYIDKYVYFTQAELRRHLFGRFSMVVFGGIGNTHSHLHDISGKAMKYVYGVGGRFQTNKHEKIHLRIDYARARYGDTSLYLTISEAF
ncbi:MAG: BamA/TamA family outer membrane protein [Bacteroidales bacterium]|jgi:outer membrane protein assembly factor BamA|nr:BamA/TamA family outer membrane protein [Bacteroidales bacterium]